MKPVCLCLLAASAALAGDWPQFRGPSASGIGDGANPPVHWDAAKGTNILWSTEIPGLSLSSPIVWGDRIFLTTAISSDPTQTFRTGLFGDTDSAPDTSPHQWKVLALDKQTGKILWIETAHQGAPKTKRHPKSSQASPTPVTDGKVVVAYFGSEGLYAYSTAGKLLWKKDLGIQNAGWFFDPDSEWGAASSPVIYKNTVIVLCDRQQDSFLAAFDLRDGRELWRTPRAEIPTWGTPTIVPGNDRAEIVTNGTKAIRGYDAATGKQLWTLGPNSEVVCTTPVFAHGLIYVTAGYPPVQPIYAIKAGSTGDLTLKDGKESSDAIAWSKQRGGVYLPSPLVYGDRLYTVNNNGVMTVYDARSGERVYQQRVGDGGTFTASPVAAAGKLYIATEDGDIYVVSAGDKYELLAKNPIGEPMLATPAFSGDLLLVRGAKHLFAIAERPHAAAIRKHVTVYHEAGRFGGWPANHGIWSWGHEILVGFSAAYFQPNDHNDHPYDRSKPEEPRLARSLDAGQTWSIESPAALVPPTGMFTGSAPGGQARDLTEPLDFTRPGFAMTLRMTDAQHGRSWLFYSYDRGHTWTGPVNFPMLGQTAINARTDYIIDGPRDAMVFLTAAKPNGREGRPLCARTRDGGLHWEFVSWIAPDPGEGFTIMPSSVRLSPTEILTAVRHEDSLRHGPNWIDAYVSRDNGATWTFLSRPAPDTGGKSGNPPSMIRLRDGRIAITYGRRTPPYNILARLSRDNGKTWGDEIVLRDGGGAWDIGYTRTVQVTDGSIVTAYYWVDDPKQERIIAATIWDPGN